MSVDIKISEPKLVWSAPVNEATSKWGVYCIPRMWKNRDGKLVVRFNGEEDSSDVDNMQRVPNRHFLSRDNGESWDGVQGGTAVQEGGVRLSILDSCCCTTETQQGLLVMVSDNTTL